MKIQEIFLSEELENELLDYGQLNTDVIVCLKEGGKYKANFIALKKLRKEFETHQKKATNYARQYYWSENMVIVKNMNKKNLLPMIEYMIEEGDFQLIFEKL